MTILSFSSQKFKIRNICEFYHFTPFYAVLCRFTPFYAVLRDAFSLPRIIAFIENTLTYKYRNGSISACDNC
jgi:hypothetical protein